MRRMYLFLSIVLGACGAAEDEPAALDEEPVPEEAELAGPDTVPPQTIINSHPPALTNVNYATFVFTASEPAEGYLWDINLPGVFGATGANTITVTDLAEGVRTFRVAASDLAGNLDPTPATYTWTIDLTPPETIITSVPPNPSSTSAVSFGFMSTEGGSKFRCKIDSLGWGWCNTGVMYGLANGTHTFSVRAIDRAGNIDLYPATHTFVIDDHTPPQTYIVVKPPALTEDTTAYFAFSSNSTGSTFRCQLDGLATEPCNAGNVTYRELSMDTHTFSVYATDAAGNIDPTPATYIWKITIL